MVAVKCYLLPGIFYGENKNFASFKKKKRKNFEIENMFSELLIYLTSERECRNIKYKLVVSLL